MSDCCCITSLVYTLGVLGLFRVLYELYKTAIQVFPPKVPDLASKYGKGSYAIVTGSTSGIGKAYTFYLARQGFNLVCISRDPVKLAAREKELKKINPKIKILSIKKDFVNSHSQEFYFEIAKAISVLDVSILINNVGVLPSVKVPFFQKEEDILKNTVAVNSHSAVGMISTVYPRLKERTLKSLVVTVSSVAHLGPMPYMSMY